MPIRTNRGRAAVYRRLWGWPLRSPKHLAWTGFVLVVLIVAVGIFLPKIFGRPADPTPIDAFGSTSSTSSVSRPFAGSATAGTSPLPTRLSGPPSPPAVAAPNPDALKVAKDWAVAWVNHPEGVTTEQWLTGLAPFTTEEYLPVMSTVDPRNIPASRVTGEPVAKQSYASSVEAEIPTDGPRLSVTVVSTSAGWRVAHYGQAG